MQNFSDYQNNTPINIINGKINDLNSKNNLVFLEQPDQNLSCSFQSEAVGPSISRNQISDIYFSNENINALQFGLRNQILNKSEGKYNIERQNDRELKIVMRSFYLQYCRHYTHIPILKQVQDLNKLVLDWCVKDIYSNILQKNKYLKDIVAFPEPLEHPVFISQKGTKQLEFTGWM
jgi:hypothetical protein